MSSFLRVRGIKKGIWINSKRLRENYRVFIKCCVFSLKFCDFSEPCQFCWSAGVLPAWWVYTHWRRGKTEKSQSPEYFKIFGKHTHKPTQETTKNRKNTNTKQRIKRERKTFRIFLDISQLIMIRINIIILIIVAPIISRYIQTKLDGCVPKKVSAIFMNFPASVRPGPVS